MWLVGNEVEDESVGLNSRGSKVWSTVALNRNALMHRMGDFFYEKWRLEFAFDPMSLCRIPTSRDRSHVRTSASNAYKD